jgi:CheY-like chemotaxis protein
MTTSSSPGSSGSASDISRSRRKVLLVDDSSEVRAALGAALQNAGYEVETATSGLEALEKLRWGLRPCAILLDLQMPGMNGWDFRAEQKRNPALQAIPTIAMTAGHLRKEDLEEFFECITKPIDLKALEAMLRRC